MPYFIAEETKTEIESLQAKLILVETALIL
jgi:hypothetical protein